MALSPNSLMGKGAVQRCLIMAVIVNPSFMPRSILKGLQHFEVPSLRWYNFNAVLS